MKKKLSKARIIWMSVIAAVVVAAGIGAAITVNNINNGSRWSAIQKMCDNVASAIKSPDGFVWSGSCKDINSYCSSQPNYCDNWNKILEKMQSEEKTTSSSKPTTTDSSQNSSNSSSNATTSTASAGMNLSQIQKGDFSSINGTWKNATDGTIAKFSGDIMEMGNTTYSLKFSSISDGIATINAQGNQYMHWFDIECAPKGTDATAWIQSSTHSSDLSDITDKTKDRMTISTNGTPFAGGDGGTGSYWTYYKEN